jgi:hypothetical protein
MLPSSELTLPRVTVIGMNNLIFVTTAKGIGPLSVAEVKLNLVSLFR